jgi:hypothetical protein
VPPNRASLGITLSVVPDVNLQIVNSVLSKAGISYRITAPSAVTICAPDIIASVENYGYAP